MIISESINGKVNETLKEDFSAFIQKVTDLPETIFAPASKKEVHWSE
jgi:hypothetical protein